MMRCITLLTCLILPFSAYAEPKEDCLENVSSVMIAGGGQSDPSVPDILCLGDKESEVEARLGHPSHIDPAKFSEKDGLYHQNWSYEHSSLVVNLIWLPTEGEYQVYSLNFAQPSSLRTAQGIAIGSTMPDVLAAYDPVEFSELGIIYREEWGLFSLTFGMEPGNQVGWIRLGHPLR